MANVRSRDEAQGTIGGVSYWELPGSPRIEYSEFDVRADRVFRIAWSDQQAFIDALTETPFTVSPALPIANYQYPSFPGNWANRRDNKYMTKLVVKSVSVEPAHDGRQQGITTASASGSGNNQIASYTDAWVTVIYGIEIRDKHRSELITNPTSKRTYGYTYQQDNEQALDVDEMFYNQEVVTRIRATELTDSSHDKSIYELAQPNLALRKLNLNNINLFFPFGSKLFFAKQLLFTNYEVMPMVRFGKLTFELVYRFMLPPGYYDDPATMTWEYVWRDHTDSTKRGWKQLAESQYGTYDFGLIFPGFWEMDQPEDRVIP